MAARKILLPSVGQGAELREIVMDALGIPKTTQWFEVRFAFGEAVSVTCQYLPAEQAIPAEDGDDGQDEPNNHGGLNG